MKALGVALAACCAVVFWPSAARANPIGAHQAAEKTRLATVPGSQAFDGDHDADDGSFTAQAGLDHSVHFAATGAIDAGVFNDDRESLGHVIDVDGLSTDARHLITLGLRLGHHDGDDDRDDRGPGEHEHGHGGAPTVPHGRAVLDPPAGGGTSTSATPEPASVLLIATGLAGLVLCRRQLFT